MKKTISVIWALSLAIAGAHCTSPRKGSVPVTDAIEDASTSDVGMGGMGAMGGMGGSGGSAPPTDTAMMPPLACSNGSECASGFCVASVCCNTACEGSCQSCKVTGREGTCEFVAAGSACGEASCAMGVALPPSTCDGKGSCVMGVAQACAPFMCGANACTSACTVDGECAEEARCVSGQCMAERPSIVSVAPSQGFVASATVFVVTFTQKMDQASTAAAVSLMPGIAVNATWNAEGTVLTLQPTSPLLPLPSNQDPKLILTVGTSAKNSKGSLLDSDAPVVFNYKRLRKYENHPCSFMDAASVTSGYMGGRLAPDVIEAGTAGTNVPGRTIQSRGLVRFACGGVELQQAQEIVRARLVFKVETRGAPSSPDVIIKPVPVQIEYTADSYSVEAIGEGFNLNANAPSTWTLDVTSLIKLPEVRSGYYYTFRAETASSPTLSGFDGYNLSKLAEPQMVLDFIAP